MIKTSFLSVYIIVWLHKFSEITLGHKPDLSLTLIYKICVKTLENLKKNLIYTATSKSFSNKVQLALSNKSMKYKLLLLDAKFLLKKQVLSEMIGNHVKSKVLVY